MSVKFTFEEQYNKAYKPFLNQNECVNTIVLKVLECNNGNEIL